MDKEHQAEDGRITNVEQLKVRLEEMREAQRKFSLFTQEQVDRIFYEAAMAANHQRIPLAKLAAEETGMGVVEDKVIKNHYAAEYIYNKYKNEKTCGVIEDDPAFGYKRIAEPIGLIAAVIPTTNPTSTAIFKTLISLKTRNAIIISPHPRAKKCTIAAAKVVLDAAVKAGAPEGIISWIDEPSLSLIHIFIESALDDPEHISLDGYSDRLAGTVRELKEEVAELLRSADNGRLISEGIKTVILGRPNAGKSSVLNLLLGEERAIVTDVAGTTRDTLEEHLNFNGISLNLMDTAGIRKTEDLVEKIGVDRAMEHAKDADLILYVVDSSEPLSAEDEAIISMIREKQAIVLLNKSDLEQKITAEDLWDRTGKQVILFSAKERTGLSELSEAISKMFFSGEVQFHDEIYLNSARQKDALRRAEKSLEKVRESIDNRMPEDFYSIDLMDAYEALGSVIGESVEEDLVNEIFSKFCMGK